MRVRYVGGIPEVIDGRAAVEIIEEDEPIEERNFLDGAQPLTMEQRRARVAEGTAAIERDRAEDRRVFHDYFLNGGEVPVFKRAQTTGTTAGGGAIVPGDYVKAYEVSEQQADEINSIATLITTEKGSAFDYPIMDTASATASAVAENGTTSTSAPLVLDRIAFGRTPTARADDIISSMELATDSAFPLEPMIFAEAGRRLGRYGGAAAHTALIAGADVGATAAATGAVTGDEILDLVASVDEKYAANGAFLMTTATMTALRKLKGSTSGDYLLPFGKDATGRKTLFDFPVYISPSMDALGAGNKPIAFGQLNRVLKRVVRNSLTIQTLVERYAPAGQIGWCVRVRMDFKLAKSAGGPMPIRLLACHA